MMKKDFKLREFSNPELLRLVDQAKNELRRRRNRKPITIVRNRIVRAALDAGYSIKDLFGIDAGFRGSKGTKVRIAAAKRARVAKFRNPADPTATWSGIGKPPKWFRDAVEGGTTRESMLIPS